VEPVAATAAADTPKPQTAQPAPEPPPTAPDTPPPKPVIRPPVNTVRPAGGDCNPPYYFDSAGKKHYKRQCG
jgi:hypothetical protein